MVDTNTLNKADEFSEMATTLLSGGFPTEAKAVLEKGIAANAFSGESLTRAQADLTRARTGADADRKDLPGADQALAAAKTGNEMVATGKLLFNVGQYAKAADAFRKGLAKGGVTDVDDANALLGIALVRGGKGAEAIEAFGKIRDPKLGEIGRLWKLLVETSAAPAAAPAPRRLRRRADRTERRRAKATRPPSRRATGASFSTFRGTVPVRGQSRSAQPHLPELADLGELRILDRVERLHGLGLLAEARVGHAEFGVGRVQVRQSGERERLLVGGHRLGIVGIAEEGLADLVGRIAGLGRRPAPCRRPASVLRCSSARRLAVSSVRCALAWSSAENTPAASPFSSTRWPSMA